MSLSVAHLYFEIGSPCIDQSGLVPTEICLPLRLDLLGLKMSATMLSNFFFFETGVVAAETGLKINT